MKPEIYLDLFINFTINNRMKIPEHNGRIISQDYDNRPFRIVEYSSHAYRVCQLSLLGNS